MPVDVNVKNRVNAEQDRLDEIKNETLANRQVLKDIQEEKAALNQEKGKFETYKEAELKNLDDQRAGIKREADALERMRKVSESQNKF